jgi:hypothetical protein
MQKKYFASAQSFDSIHMQLSPFLFLEHVRCTCVHNDSAATGAWATFAASGLRSLVKHPVDHFGHRLHQSHYLGMP